MKEFLAEIFEAYYTDVYTYLYSLCRNASLAEDLTSEVFLSVATSLSSFRGESDIKTWLFTIARRKWFDHLRKQKRELPTESIHLLFDCAMPGTTNPEEDGLSLIRQFLQSEPERVRAVVQMRLEGYSHYEIAQRQKISENSARVIWFRAKNRLKQYLEKEGITL